MYFIPLRGKKVDDDRDFASRHFFLEVFEILNFERIVATSGNR